MSRPVVNWDVYKAIADDNRRIVLDILARGEQPVGSILVRLELSQPALSQHLKILRDVGLVLAVELPLHRRDQHHVLRGVAARGGPGRRLADAEHEPLEARGHDEGRGGVDEEHLEQLQGRHLGQGEPPGVVGAQRANTRPATSRVAMTGGILVRSVLPRGTG